MTTSKVLPCPSANTAPAERPSAAVIPKSIDEYYNREVKPHLPDSWMDRSKDKIGYEINFAKYFYKYTPLRNLEDISHELKSLDDEIKHLTKEMNAK